MSASDRHAPLVSWLNELGHTPNEIERILTKVDEYDRETIHESVFDSIAAGHFDLTKIIDEALGRSAGEN